ncbi:MAG TPA: FAD-linked oxidase C-terminal domain-containing protein [Kiritimatiellia bacterium]|nr:FAD-linked oxidase C-terminal domain-containing protein [Kiritimatiellia bacterium]
MNRSTIEALAGIVGAEHVLAEPDQLIAYGFDGTAAMTQRPAAVVFPRNRDQVAGVLRLANQQRIPVVPRGSGTSLSGSALPVPDGLVLCLAKMDRILEVDPANLQARVQPGVRTAMLNSAALAHGLFYPPDPGSMAISTLGGNVNHNSGGLRGLKYGVTRDYILGLEVVLANGDVLRTGSACVKDSAGYRLKDLFIGSEGTLGIITEILVKLLPKPAAVKTLLASFASIREAADTVSAIIAHPVIPCTLEFLDRVTIQCVEEYANIGLPLDAGALLLMETDGHPAVVAEEAEVMTRIARDHGALFVRTAETNADAEQLRTARRSAFSALARRSPTVILEDATVPRSRLAEMVVFIQETAERHHLRVGTFGHMGDGNLHPTFLTDERDAGEMKRVHAAFTEIFEKAVALGGTITGEHGIGLAKKEFLPLVVDATGLRLHQAIKSALDPNGILNPGKIF